MTAIWNILFIFTIISQCHSSSDLEKMQTSIVGSKFTHSYFTNVLGDGEGDFYIGIKHLSKLTKSLPACKIEKILFVFAVEQTDRVSHFAETLKDIVREQKINWCIAGYKVQDIVRINEFNLDLVFPQLQWHSLSFVKPSIEDQLTPVLHLIGPINSELSHKCHFGSLKMPSGENRRIFFHGELGSSLGVNRSDSLYYLLKLSCEQILEDSLKLGFQALSSTEDKECMRLGKALERINQLVTMEKKQFLGEIREILNFFSWTELSKKLQPYIIEEAKLYLEDPSYSHQKSFVPIEQHKALGFLNKPTSMGNHISAPGYGIFISQERDKTSKEDAKKVVFRFLNTLSKSEKPEDRHNVVSLSKFPHKFQDGTFDPRKIHIIFGANSRLFTPMNIKSIIISVNEKFETLYPQGHQVILLFKVLETDVMMKINAAHSAKFPSIALVSCAKRIPEAIYQKFQDASSWIVTSGDNALMDSYSLGIWPFHLYHTVLCKSRETMFPSPRFFQDSFYKAAAQQGYKEELAKEILETLGTDRIPSDEAMECFRRVIPSYLLQTCNYEDRLLEWHNESDNS